MIKLNKIVADGAFFYINITEIKSKKEQDILYEKISKIVSEWNSTPKVYGQ